MNLLFFVALIQAEIFDLQDYTKEPFEILFNVIESQICKGFFEPLGPEYSYEVTIFGEAGNKVYSNKNIQGTEQFHFSFNLVEEQDLTMQILAKPRSPEALGYPAELHMQFNTQFDTFDKEVAKDTRIEPAMYALTRSDKYSYDLINLSDDWGQKVGLVDREHKSLFNFITLLSCGTFLVYLSVNVYQMYAMKKFLKQKKLI